MTNRKKEGWRAQAAAEADRQFMEFLIAHTHGWINKSVRSKPEGEATAGSGAPSRPASHIEADRTGD